MTFRVSNHLNRKPSSFLRDKLDRLNMIEEPTPGQIAVYNITFSILRDRGLTHEGTNQ